MNDGSVFGSKMSGDGDTNADRFCALAAVEESSALLGDTAPAALDSNGSGDRHRADETDGRRAGETRLLDSEEDEPDSSAGMGSLPDDDDEAEGAEADSASVLFGVCCGDRVSFAGVPPCCCARCLADLNLALCCSCARMGAHSPSLSRSSCVSGLKCSSRNRANVSRSSATSHAHAGSDGANDAERHSTPDHDGEAGDAADDAAATDDDEAADEESAAPTWPAFSL